jgi:hypothetical protein
VRVSRDREQGFESLAALRPITQPVHDDGALGFRKALEEVFPGTRDQRCWVYKTVNVLDKVLPALGAGQHEEGLAQDRLSEPGVHRSGGSTSLPRNTAPNAVEPSNVWSRIVRHAVLRPFTIGSDLRRVASKYRLPYLLR